MLRINPAQSADFNAAVSGPEYIDSSSTDISFQYNVEDRINRENTKESVENTLKANKQNIELNIPWIGTDYIIYKGDGKTTYGQLRENLGIPAQVLSETNNKRLADDQLVDETRINLNDIGWYRVMPQSDIEAQDIKAQRRYGNHYAGYDRAVTNNDVIKYLK